MKLLIIIMTLFTQTLWAQTCTQLKDCLGIASKLSGITFLVDKGVIEGNPKVKGMLFNPDNADTLLTDLLIHQKLALELTGSPNLYKIVKLPSRGEPILVTLKEGVPASLHPALLVEMSYTKKNKKIETTSLHVREARLVLKKWRESDK
jgi:hypothetical protein